MKKIVCSGLCCFLLVCALVCPLQAAQMYTVTFRAGNVGTFDCVKVRSLSGNSASVTVYPEYLKIKAPRGQTVAELLSEVFGKGQSKDVTGLFEKMLCEHTGYVLLDERVWGPKEGELISHNKEYVLDYGVVVERAPDLKMYDLSMYFMSSEAKKFSGNRL